MGNSIIDYLNLAGRLYFTGILFGLLHLFALHVIGLAIQKVAGSTVFSCDGQDFRRTSKVFLKILLAMFLRSPISGLVHLAVVPAIFAVVVESWRLAIVLWVLYLLVAGLVIFDYLKALVDLDLSHWDEVFEGEGCRAFTASYSDFLGRRYFTYCMTLGLLVSFFLLDSSGEAPLWLKEELESYPDPETGPVAAALMMIFVVFSAGSRVFRDLYYLARPELSLRDRVILSRLRGAQSSRDSDISKMLYSPKDWRSHEHKQGYFMSRLLLSSKRRFRRRFSEAENGRIVSAIDSLAGACRASLYSTASAEEFHVCSVYALALLSGRDPVDISNRVMNRFGGEEISSDYKGANVGHMLIAASDFLERINTLGKIVVLLAVAILLAWSGQFAELFDILKSIIGVS